MKILTLLLLLPALSYSQTQSRNDAGLRGDAGATSGFFETYNPVNYPAGASSWWHLLDVRHSNNANNYAMQFAGSFFDQNLYFRKTNNSATQAWSKILLVTDEKVGINTTNPSGSLEVSGHSNGAQLVLSRDNLVGEEGPGVIFKNLINNSTLEPICGIETKLLSGTIDHVAGSLNFFTVFNSAKVNAMTLSGTGNVGIGTATPAEKLSVNGKIRAQEIKVETANWPDYVFEEGYKIGTLEALESYIKANKHLPDMPSAKEVEADGMALGELVKLQQKKIEELTLYLIEKDKSISKLQKEKILSEMEVEDLKKRITQIEMYLKKSK